MHNETSLICGILPVGRGKPSRLDGIDSDRYHHVPELEIAMNEAELLSRITVNHEIFGGKPIIRGRRLAVEHVLGMLAAGDSPQTILEGYPWMEPQDIQACLAYARRVVGQERFEPALAPAEG